MAYSEELDLIQNMKNLSAEVDQALTAFNDVQPSLDQMQELQQKFTQLESGTVAVIDKYDATLTEKTKEIQDLLTDARSQFKQVTDDVESLVNLEVDFNDIKDKIFKCLEMNDLLTSISTGTMIMMESDNIIPVKDRKPYNQYCEILS